MTMLERKHEETLRAVTCLTERHCCRISGLKRSFKINNINNNIYVIYLYGFEHKLISQIKSLKGKNVYYVLINFNLKKICNRHNFLNMYI